MILNYREIKNSKMIKPKIYIINILFTTSTT